MRSSYFHLAVLLSVFCSGLRGGGSNDIPSRPAEALAASSTAFSQTLEATRKWKESLEALLPFRQAALKQALETLEKRTSLHNLGVISGAQLEETKIELAHAQAELDQTTNELDQCSQLMTETEEALVSMTPETTASLSASRALPPIIRGGSTGSWAVRDLAKISGFFQATFGRALPVSAMGQTELHHRLGFDHKNSVDVALQPDSDQGQALIAFLRAHDIPFIAFRAAVRGSATGAHIHIGLPSLRVPAA